MTKLPDNSNAKNTFIIKAKSTIDGISMEKARLAELYGMRDIDWKLEEQQVWELDDKTFDMLRIVLKNGEKKSVLFDITQWYGK